MNNKFALDERIMNRKVKLCPVIHREYDRVAHEARYFVKRYLACLQEEAPKLAGNHTLSKLMELLCSRAIARENNWRTESMGYLPGTTYFLAPETFSKAADDLDYSRQLWWSYERFINPLLASCLFKPLAYDIYLTQD